MSVPPIIVAGSALMAVAASPLLRSVADRLRIDPVGPAAISIRGRGRLVALWTPGIVWAIAVSIVGSLAPSTPTFAALAIGGGALLVASIVDLAERRIPNRITYPAIWVCVLMTGFSLITETRGGPVSSAVVGGSVFALILFLLHVIRPDAMGLGDVKLAFPLGFAMGWIVGDAAMAPAAVGLTLAGASLIGIGAASIVHAGSAASLRGQSVAFGPALSAAASVTIVLSLGLS